MPANESADEMAARELVESRLDVSLTFSDNDQHEGRVDYTFVLPDGRTAAMEVTRLTDEDLRQAASAFDKYVDAPVSVPGLRCCWSVSLDERAARYRGLPDRVGPLVLALEAAGASSGHHLVEALWSEPATREAARGLMSEAITLVDTHPDRCASHGSEGEHVVAVYRATGSVASGSDAALSVIEEELGSRVDNVRKVMAADVTEGGVFLWLDGKTDGVVSRPFLQPGPYPSDRFGLPTRAPILPSPIQWLWVVHEGTGVGWSWDGSSWSEISVAR